MRAVTGRFHQHSRLKANSNRKKYPIASAHFPIIKEDVLNQRARALRRPKKWHHRQNTKQKKPRHFWRGFLANKSAGLYFKP